MILEALGSLNTSDARARWLLDGDICCMSYEDLDVYKLSVQLAVEIYSFTTDFPKSELFGLTSQIRRSAVSIPCNLAEGSARNRPKEFNHFVGIAKGSCAELLTLLDISDKIGYSKESSDLTSKLSTIARMLTGLSKSLKTKCDSTGRSDVH